MKELGQIPGVGIKIAGELYDLGFRSIGDLKDRDPEELYERFCAYNGHKVDRCVLYVMRCAVYFASRDEHKPELLKWWNWKYVEP